MRRIATIGFLSVMTGLTSATVPAWADSNPSGTGPPNQSCQSFSASTRPGHTSSSPGSPFNESGVNSPNGGTGGQHYSEKSQYDVAWYQLSQH
jgi:hypothetical protein